VAKVTDPTDDFAERAAFAAELPARAEAAHQAIAEFFWAEGILPDGIEFKLTPMDLQADPLWVAPAPWARVEGQLLAGALRDAGQLDSFVATMRNACESVLALSRTLRLEPWPHGWNEPCFCHPKPFPAARDYRRRTKHRNRRRKS